MGISYLGVVGSASTLNHSGPLDIPITTDVPASDPVDGGTVLFIFRCMGAASGAAAGGHSPAASDSAAFSGPYASCRLPNPYSGEFFNDEEWHTTNDNLQLSGVPLSAVILNPLVAGTDTITYDEWAGISSPPNYDISVIVLAWTGVTTTSDPSTAAVEGGLLQRSLNSGTNLQWENPRGTPPINTPQSSFAQTDSNNLVRIPPGGYTPPGGGFSWQYDSCDLGLYILFDSGHNGDITVAGVDWTDPDVTEIASILNFESPLSAPLDDATHGAYMSCVIGANVAPPLGTNMDFGMAWDIGGATPSGADLRTAGSVIALTEGPGPTTCSSGLFQAACI